MRAVGDVADALSKTEVGITRCAPQGRHGGRRRHRAIVTVRIAKRSWIYRSWLADGGTIVCDGGSTKRRRKLVFLERRVRQRPPSMRIYQDESWALLASRGYLISPRRSTWSTHTRRQRRASTSLMCTSASCLQQRAGAGRINKRFRCRWHFTSTADGRARVHDYQHTVKRRSLLHALQVSVQRWPDPVASKGPEFASVTKY